MTAIGFGPRICGQLAEGATREWLLPDGRGGYAMGTVSGLRTRRYHALLVASGDAPAARHVGLVSLDPVLTLPGGGQVRLGCHEWASGAVDPPGHELLERFDLIDGVPRWRWRAGEVVLERELAVVRADPEDEPGGPGAAAGAAGAAGTAGAAAGGGTRLAVVHRLLAGGPVRLTLSALCTWRDAHGERGASGAPPRVVPAAGGAVVEDAYRLAGPGWRAVGEWWHAVYHREEAARGLPPCEDLWHAGQFTADLAEPGDSAQVWAWAGQLEQAPAGPAEQAVRRLRRRNRAVVATARPADELSAALALAADAFVVRTGAGPDVVAGYPWFGTWSRDTMTAYEGLFLSTGRAAAGRELLRGYAATLSEGMLANTADTGRTEYNTSDATLWFLHAVERHVRVTGDTDLAAELLPALATVVTAHRTGTRYGIRVDPADGLLTQNDDAGRQALTWMDARVDGVPVTPRAGKAVEINALWVNGLAALAALCERTGLDAGRRGNGGPGAGGLDAPGLNSAHEAARVSFRRRFPLKATVDNFATGTGLVDVLDTPDGTADPAVRPNQLLAWSLPYAPMPADRRALRMLGARLMTPLGPRSLAPDSPGYLGSHRGGPAQRDRAYHQGTVWPWLIGPYADACRKSGVPTGELLGGIAAHLSEWGLGSVTETADGQAPHAATGCPFQAWSVAEALRVRRMDQ